MTDYPDFAGAAEKLLEQQGELNKSYRDRAHLVAVLAAMLPSHIGRSDPNEPTYSVVIIETPYGQISYHIADRDLDLFARVRPTDDDCPVWDGHTTDEKNSRLCEMIGALSGNAPWMTGETPEQPAPAGDRLAAEVVIDVCDLEGDGDLDDLKARLEEAAAPWKPTISVTPRTY